MHHLSSGSQITTDSPTTLHTISAVLQRCKISHIDRIDNFIIDSASCKDVSIYLSAYVLLHLA